MLPKPGCYTYRMPSHPKRPRDPNQLAKLIVDLSTGEAEDSDPDAGKNKAAQELSRLGASKGGVARSKTLTPEQRRKIAKKAAEIRWAAKAKDDA